MSTNLKFITGLSAEAHIKPSMDAQWHSALVGKESVVLDYGTKFETTLNTANATISIGDGIGMVQGRFFIIEESLVETISYPTVPPEVGLTRIDTIVLHWGTDTKIVNGETVTVNTCEFEYVRNPLADGTAQEFDETDLNLGDTEAWFPMWHVTWTENGIQSITSIFKIIPSIWYQGVLVVDCGTRSSLPYTRTGSSIRKEHVVLNSVLTNPAAQTGDWTVTTEDGSLTISGSISGSTGVTLYLGLSM